jgi:integrase
MNLHFQLDHPNKGRSAIILTYHYQGSRFRYSLGIQGETAKWDKNREIIRQQAGSNLINAKIIRMRAVFEEMIYHFEKIHKRHPSWSEMKEYLNVHYKGDHPELKDMNPIEPRCMLTYIKDLIDDWDANGRIQPSSIKVYRRTYNILKAVFMKTPLSPEQFIDEGPTKFVEYMRTKNKLESYVEKSLGNYIVFAGWACKDPNVPEITSHKIKKSHFGLKDYSSDAIYLKKEHVKMLEDIDFRQKPDLDVIRDIFLFSVYTGMRYSDLNNPKQWRFNETSNGNKYLIYTAIKTTTITEVPLKQKALNLLNKYSYNFPTRCSKDINEKIKEIGRLAGLTDVVTKTRKLYKREITTTMFLYERISIHTGRRSFCSLALSSGAPDRTIMAFSGHKSPESFKRYILQSKEDHINDARQYEFFN